MGMYFAHVVGSRVSLVTPLKLGCKNQGCVLYEKLVLEF